MRKSLALAFAVAGATPTMAADWSGVFVGATGGYGTGHQSQQGGVLRLPSRGGGGMSGGSSGSMSSIFSSSIGSGTSILGDGGYSLSGGLVGAAVGYNWQSGRFVYGIEGDGSYADVGATGTCGFGGAAPHACGGSIRSLGTVRGNIGYDISDMGFGILGGGARVFAAGGLAVAEVKAFDSFLGNQGVKTVAGYTIGGGIEALLGAHWSVKLEYLHVDLGQHDVLTALPPNPERVRTTAELVRVGLSYHFNTPVAPVVAKY